MSNSCKHCEIKLVGRADKKFCSVNCKNKYNYDQRQRTKSSTQPVINLLLRNREILATLVGSSTKYTIDKMVLDHTGFKYDYHTGHYLNKEGKSYWIVFDYAWMAFSDQKIMIVRKAK